MYIPLGERELAKEIEQRGVEKGIEKKAFDVARTMLVRGMALQEVAEIVGLPVEQVRTLIN